MRKTLSLILCALMILPMLFIGIGAADPNYNTANDGDVLYTVDFRGTDGIYAPFVFRAANADVAKATWVASDDGKSLVGTAVSDPAGAVFFGSAIKGLTVGAGKKYTMTMKVAFPTGNAGVYYNIASLTNSSGYDPAKDATYLDMFGLYGQIKSGNCMTMSYGAGGKLAGEKVSQQAAYTPVPEGVANDDEGFVNVTIKIDGFFYSVWFNDKLYDSYLVDQVSYDVCPNLGFSVYLYNKSASVTVKDVVIKKGCDYAASNTIYNKSFNYDSFALGAKITDINFDAKSGAFVAHRVQDTDPGNVKYEIADGGKTIMASVSGSSKAHWYGDDFNGLRITDSTKYTFIYKVKNNQVNYTGCVAYNGKSSVLNSSYRYNWYGVFTTGDKYANPKVKLAADGSNFTGYNYNDDPMKVFQSFNPKIDSDGYTEVAAELDGWNWTFYMTDAATGKLTKVQTANVKELGTADNKFNANANALSFIVYTYNDGVSFSVKDAALYKGTTVSVDYPAPADPVTPTPTGDITVWVVVVAAVSLLGMGIALKARKA